MGCKLLKILKTHGRHTCHREAEGGEKHKEKREEKAGSDTSDTNVLKKVQNRELKQILET